jgi:hypothetical protein
VYALAYIRKQPPAALDGKIKVYAGLDKFGVYIQKGSGVLWLSYVYWHLVAFSTGEQYFLIQNRKGDKTSAERYMLSRFGRNGLRKVIFFLESYMSYFLLVLHIDQALCFISRIIHHSPLHQIFLIQ